MRSPVSDPNPASGWMTVDLGSLSRAWSAPATSGPAAAPAPETRPDTPVVSLAARRDAGAPPAPRRVPEADILTIARPAPPRPAAAPAPPADVLDLADLDPPELIPFQSSAEREERHRRILYLTAAAIIMATGAVYTYKSAAAARAVHVPAPEIGNRIA